MYRAKKGYNPDTKKWPYVSNSKEGHADLQITTSCNQCWGCRLERSRIWAIRCMHEHQLYESENKPSEFLTLTYNNENLPHNHTLIKSHLQKFWKRLRKHGYKFRYFACGEYGDETHRPHYHAIMFGLHINDKIYHTTSNDNKLYTSKKIEKIWGHGHVLIGNVTFESCAYVARYIMKKRLGNDSETYYDIYDEDGVIIDSLTPEFSTQSRKPGIGFEFYKKYKQDIYGAGRDGTVIIRGGTKCKPPKFYENKFEQECFEHNTETYNQIKIRRKEKAELNASDNTVERLMVKERLALNIINKKLPRKMEQTNA